MTPHLLQVVTPPRPGTLPLYVELPVDPETGPFLVTRASSQEAMMWITRARTTIRAATRSITLDDLYVAVVRQVIDKGREDGWGNAHPLTKAGLEAAIEYVHSYGFMELEILAHPKLKWGTLDPAWSTSDREMVLAYKNTRVQPAAWLDTGTIVVVPADRQFVGLALMFDEGLVGAVHNAARGIGIATQR